MEFKDRVKFFTKHSGRVGKKASAEVGQQLACAEVCAELAGWTYEWILEEEDWNEFLGEGMTLDDVQEVLYVNLIDEEGEIVQSLGGIIDPDKLFVRITEAELAWQELGERELM